jgi:hypothetical protein
MLALSASAIVVPIILMMIYCIDDDCLPALSANAIVVPVVKCQ